MKILPSILIIVFFNVMPIVFILVLTRKGLRDRLNDDDIKAKMDDSDVKMQVVPDLTQKLDVKPSRSRRSSTRPRSMP